MDFLTCLFVFILIFALYTYWRLKDLPPGPYGLPLLGYAPFLDRKYYETLTKLAQKYGNIYSINLANQLTVVVNDWTTITEVLVKQGQVFSGRPKSFALDYLLERKEIVSADGQVWKEQKRFCLSILQELGMGKSSLENIIMEEVDSLTKQLERHNKKAIQVKSIFFVPVSNIIWGLVSGKRFDPTDSSTIAFQNAIADFAIIMSNATLLNLLPALRFILPDISGYTKLTAIKKIFHKYFEQEIEERLKNHHENSNMDFIDSYLSKIKKHQLKSGKEVPPYTMEHLICTITILFIAGGETVSSTLNWAILYMTLHPNIQQKVQEELDTVIGENSHLSMASKALTPYTEATILEIQRLANIAPLLIPHSSTRDTVLKGYKIPKGTTVLTNVWSLHHNEKYWDDPYMFHPERFLDDSGKVRNDTKFLPFSAGPRLCLGEHMAKMELFLFFTCLMHRFSFHLIPGQPKPTLEPVVGLELMPTPYSVIVERR